MSKSQKRRAAKRAARTAEKTAKKHPVLTALVVVLVLVLLLAAAYWYLFLYEPEETVGPSRPQEGTLADIVSSDLSVHFLDVGNKYAGDSVLVKSGNTELLIDAGSRQGSAATLTQYISQYCTDGVLEYVVATHADQDHIAAFVGTKQAPGIFESYDCKTIIDFPRTNKNSQILQNYRAKRDEEVEGGAAHYTALECWKEENGAKRTYALSETVSMSVLYNYYYEHDSSDENNYSVCLLITQGEDHYLFTGDLEEKGEEYLVQYNDLPKCKLFKAGHHGSPTSSNDVLLSVIQPEYVCVCCCAGSTEYTTNKDNTFPSQAFIDRISKYTENVYVTNVIDGESYKNMNGNVVFYTVRQAVGYTLNLWCSNNSEILKDTEWFSKNRVWAR